MPSADYYKTIQKYAAQRGIDLNDGWRVWAVEKDSVSICPNGDLETFETYVQAHFWARTSISDKAVIITGPQQPYISIPVDDVEFDKKLNL